MKPRIAFLMGDVGGVGPEMSAKLLADPAIRLTADIVLIADPVVLDLPAMSAQFHGEGSKGGEVEDAFDLVGWSRVARLNEQHAIPPDLPGIEGGILQSELIAENEQGVFHYGHGK